jgi:hypothetical protein
MFIKCANQGEYTDMTKEVRDNFDGLTYDEDDTMGFVFTDRHDPRGFVKVEGDISRESFLRIYGEMAKKPKYQLWVRATEEEREANPAVKGHWEKL